MQHTATHYNALQYNATHCDTPATHYNTLHYTAPRYNTLQRNTHTGAQTHKAHILNLIFIFIGTLCSEKQKK